MTTARKKKQTNKSIVNSSISPGTTYKGRAVSARRAMGRDKNIPTCPLYFAALLPRLSLRYYCIIAASLMLFLRNTALLLRYYSILLRYYARLPHFYCIVTALLLCYCQFFTLLLPRYYCVIIALLLCYCFAITAFIA